MNYQPTMLDDSDLVLREPVTPVEDYTYDQCFAVVKMILGDAKRCGLKEWLDGSEGQRWKKLLEDTIA